MIYKNIDCFISINSDGSINNSGITIHHVMQYTGLKNIYEGDLLQNTTGIIGEVIYIEGSFCWKYKNKNGKTLLSTLNNGMLNNKTVIGNIYENKDLLK